MDALIKQYGVAKELEKYPLEDALKEVVSAIDALNKYSTDEINDWPVKQFPWCNHAPTLRQLVDDFQVKVAELQSYKTIIDRHRNKSKTGLVLTKRNDRTHRDAFRNVFEEPGTSVPACVAMAAGDLLYAWLSEPDDISSSTQSALNEMRKGMMTDPSVWKSPMFLRPSASMADDDRTHYHAECDRIITELRPAVDTKVQEVITGMRRAGLFTGKGCVDTPPCTLR